MPKFNIFKAFSKKNKGVKDVPNHAASSSDTRSMGTAAPSSYSRNKKLKKHKPGRGSEFYTTPLSPIQSVGTVPTNGGSRYGGVSLKDEGFLPPPGGAHSLRTSNGLQRGPPTQAARSRRHGTSEAGGSFMPRQGRHDSPISEKEYEPTIFNAPLGHNQSMRTTGTRRSDHSPDDRHEGTHYTGTHRSAAPTRYTGTQHAPTHQTGTHHTSSHAGHRRAASQQVPTVTRTHRDRDRERERDRERGRRRHKSASAPVIVPPSPMRAARTIHEGVNQRPEIVKIPHAGEPSDFYIVPDGVDVEFRDAMGNVLGKVGDPDSNLPRRVRPLIIQDESGRELARVGDFSRVRSDWQSSPGRHRISPPFPEKLEPNNGIMLVDEKGRFRTIVPRQSNNARPQEITVSV
ncbi:hypothetical protein EV715DRAFT_245744 [Schizophyllum commune]